MKKRFIETAIFTQWVEANASSWDEIYAEFQNRLMENPELGRLIAGCGGLRKIRLADPKRGKGKRGGARIIYLNISQADWIYLLAVYDKEEKESLSAAEKKILAQLAERLKSEARAAAKREISENDR